MSFVITTILRCNGCTEKEVKVVGNSAGKKDAERKATTENWTIVDDKHYCPDCTKARKEG